MPSIKINDFSGGLNTQLAPHLLGLNEAVRADGCSLENGAIVPLASSVAVGSVPAGTKSLYRFGGAWETSTGERWWAEMNGRLYWADSSTDGGVPQKKVGGTKYRLGVPAPTLSAGPTATYATTAGAAAVATFKPPFTAEYAMTNYAGSTGSESAPAFHGAIRTDTGATLHGDISPADTTIKVKVWLNNLSAPGAFWNAIGGGAGVIKIGDEVITFTSEGPATPPAGLISGLQYYHVLTGCTRGVNGTTATAHKSDDMIHCFIESVSIPVPAATDPQVTGRRLYRLVAGEYRLVIDVASPSTPTNFTDKIASMSLGYLLDSEDNELPPNLTGLCGPYNGMVVGWKDRSVYLSRSGYPDAWPVDAKFDFPTPVAACAVYGGMIVVLTKAGVYSLSGYAHDAMRMAEAQGSIGTTYGRTVAVCSRGVLYVARDEGIVLFDGLRSEVISRNKLKGGSDGIFRDDLMSQACAIFHKDKYLLFYAYGFLAGDFRFGAAAWTINAHPVVSGAAVSLDDLGLYLAVGGSLYQWASGTSGTWTYETGTLVPAAMRVVPLHTIRVAYGGKLTIKLVKKSNTGGVSVPRTVFTGDTGPFGSIETVRIRIPAPSRYADFSVLLSGTGTLSSLELEYS